MNQSFGDRLRVERLAIIVEGRPMSQYQLAIRLRVDVSTVRNWESGRKLPHPMFREKILEIFPKIFDPVPLTVA